MFARVKQKKTTKRIRCYDQPGHFWIRALILQILDTVYELTISFYHVGPERFQLSIDNFAFISVF